MTTLWIAAAFVAAYLIGSLSFAVIVSRAMGLDDPRSYGSGNPGATNVLRSGSKKAAVLTLLLDAVKGLIPVLLVRLFGERAGLGEGSAMLVGLGAFLGHLWPVFFRFQGGKGVATAAGVLLGFEPLLGLGVLALWILVAKTTKYSSLAALIAAGSAPLLHAIFWGGSSATLAIFVMSLLLIWRHGSNIAKLINGTESRIGQKARPAAAGTPPAGAAPAAAPSAPANRAERRRSARQARRKTH
ncbi:glycerol-3-phosphate 1-O-acyltransferase PlsY [Sphaerotilus uruguayifluvii]|uniref:Glycerol-3-phosphate acyltransferase n=1 Tax=Sphaerotilus uruguayifluvii TaxID=2735897 RepID=A0ABX2G6C2_9BURK|nr:glycerol-3-phosphate 1-O-acyltransferase PlsY [Leptothrix sp. C29]NRT57885.1 glycerol-3-phosphate acyltransferase PlsY [Leptothrix sp. C29]